MASFLEKLKLVILLLPLLFISVIMLANCVAADTLYMENCFRNYFSKTRHHDVDPVYKNRTMNFIREEFERFGLETQMQIFPDGRVSNSTNFTNVIGLLKGERFGQLTDRILGVGAHYDTVPTTPGVDDNGAGVAAMLEVARQLTEMNTQGTKRQNTIVFVSFDIEEEGLYGSEAFVNQWFIPSLLQNYGADYQKMEHYGVVVMDVPMEYNRSEHSQAIIGPKDYDLVFSQYFPEIYSHLQENSFRGDFLALIFRNDSMDSELADTYQAAWKVAGPRRFRLESFAVPVINVTTIATHPVLGNFLRSDHTRFWLKEFPAIFLSDSANFRGDGTFCYHRPCDNVDVYLTEDNMKFLGKTADSITKALDTLSKRHKPHKSGTYPQFSTSPVIAWVCLIFTCTSFSIG